MARFRTHPFLDTGYSNVVAFPGMGLHSHDAAGSRAGHSEDATAGLGSITDGAGLTWFWNTAQSEWQPAHTIKSGDTLWRLTKLYYGAYSLPGVSQIHEVPQNLAIQGPDANVGLIPGDVILIPGLPQPAAAPAAANDVPLVVPQDVRQVVSTTTQTQPGDGTVPANDLPAGWPAGVPYPPTNVVATDPAGNNVTTLPTVVVTGDVVPAGTGPGVKKAAIEPFWTGGKIAIGVAVGVAGVGTIIYLATRKKKRRNSSRWAY